MHAGDIGDASILRALARIAPVTAVRGNNDFGAWADALHEIEAIALADLCIGVVHDANSLGTGLPESWDAIVAGHSHRPLCEARDGVLHFNPGSAGPRRFTLPVTVGEIVVDGGALRGRIIDLAV